MEKNKTFFKVSPHFSQQRPDSGLPRSCFNVRQLNAVVWFHLKGRARRRVTSSGGGERALTSLWSHKFWLPAQNSLSSPVCSLQALLVFNCTRCFQRRALVVFLIYYLLFLFFCQMKKQPSAKRDRRSSPRLRVCVHVCDVPAELLCQLLAVTLPQHFAATSLFTDWLPEQCPSPLSCTGLLPDF